MGAIKVHEFITLDGVIENPSVDDGLRLRPEDG